MTEATIIASSFLLGSLLLMVLVGLNLAYAQTPNNGDDLNQTAVPEFDFNNVVDKSMVVLLNFTALNKAEFVDVDVSYGPPHSNIGNPPLLKVQIYDYNGAIIQQFNYWHPLFALEFQEDGKEYLKILPNAVGRFVFPFDPNAALMKVSYLYHEGANNTRAEEVISVDLRPTIPSFCDQFPDDPDCRASDLAVVDVSTDNGQQQLPIPVGNSADVTVQTTVTNNGPDKPIDATLSRRTITAPASDAGAVIVTPAAGATPNENGATITTITSLSERQQQHDQTYTIECWEPGKYNIIFESEIAPLSGAVVDDNQPNNKGQMNLEVDCGDIDVCPPPPEPLRVSIEANATEDGSPPSTIEFRAITEGGTPPHKFRWNFDDDGSNNSNNNYVKGGQLMTHQFARLGQYNVTVTVTDSANGSRCQTASDNIIVTISDKVPPRVIVPSKIIAEATGPGGANVTFTVSATDNVDGPVPVNCDKKKEGDTFSDTFSLTPPLTTVKCEATDKSGNTGYGSFPVTVQDTTPPTLELPTNISPVEATGPGGANVNFTVSATDIVDGPVPVNCNPLSGSEFNLGTKSVKCYAEDSFRNGVNGAFDVTVQDTTPPTLGVPTDISAVEATGPEGAIVTFPPVPATDIVDGNARLGADGILRQEDNVGGDITISCNPGSRSTFGLNTTTVECKATDNSRNSANGSFPVTVQDTTPPTLELPTNISPVEATGPGGAIVTFSVPATDIVDGKATLGEDGTTITQDQVGRDIKISCDPASGNEFSLVVPQPQSNPASASAPTSDIVFVQYVPPPNTTPVNCQARDSSGNTANGSFPVTVQDTTPPTLELPLNPLKVNSSNPELPCGITCDFANVRFLVRATDIVDGKATLGKDRVLIQEDQDGHDIEIWCDPDSGSPFLLGTKLVNCDATDSSGNTASGTFNVIVERGSQAIVGSTTSPDTTGPIITVPGDITEEATSAEGATVSFEVSAVDDVDGATDVSCNHNSGEIFLIGETVVTCTAEDAAGNTEEESFTITVEEEGGGGGDEIKKPDEDKPDEIKKPDEDKPDEIKKPDEDKPDEDKPDEIKKPDEDIQE